MDKEVTCVRTLLFFELPQKGICSEFGINNILPAKG